MKRFLATILFLGLGTVPVLADGAHGGDRVIVKPNAAHRFARLPDGVAFPEGITANPANGDIYVATFNFAGDNFVMRFRKSGRLVAMRNFGATPLLGLAFNRRDRKVYIANTGALVGDQSRIQRIAARFDASTPIEEVALIPSIGAPGDRTVDNPDGSQDIIEFGNNAPAPNALAFDAAGKLYVSDSFQGAIFSIPDPAANCPDGGACPVDTVIHHPLLATAGFPPFGANGLALNADESALFVANTGDDRVLELDLNSLDLSVFAESINGADGIAFGPSGHLWVAANQGDHVVALDANGLVVAQLGAFLGIRKDGAARGLLFPASVVILGHKLFVGNLAFPLNEDPDDEVEEMVTKYTISRINLPPLHH
jgi:DNA-binding beta-propeller fold protein YncE